MTTQPLSVVGIDDLPTVSLTEEFPAARESVLAPSRAIIVVFNPETQLAAANAERKIKDMLKAIETARKFYKDKVNTVGNDIQRVAAEASAPLEAEKTRVNNLQVAYARKLEAERRAEEERRRKAAEEAAAIERARIAEAERKKREAEAARRDAEAARLAAESAESPEARAEAEAGQRAAEAQQAATEAESLWSSQEAERAALDAELAAIPNLPAVAMAAGTRAKVTWDFEVLDAHAFAIAFPQFVKIEVRRREVLEALNAPGMPAFVTRFPEDKPAEENGPPRPPGLRVFEAMKVNVR